MNVVLFLVSTGFPHPVLWLFHSAMKTKNELNLNSIALSKHQTLDNFKNVFTIINIHLYMGNSFLVTAVAIVWILLISLWWNIFLSRFDFNRRQQFSQFFWLVCWFHSTLWCVQLQSSSQRGALRSQTDSCIAFHHIPIANWCLSCRELCTKYYKRDGRSCSYWWCFFQLHSFQNNIGNDDTSTIYCCNHIILYMMEWLLVQ